MTVITNGKPFKIACVQFEPKIGQRDSNLFVMEERIRAAHEQGAELVVLPELADSGYVFKDRDELMSLAEPIPSGVSSTRLCALAQELGLFIVSGLAEVEDENFYNSAILCGPQGYIGTYRKMHLWNKENLVFESGNLGFPVFETSLGRIGMAICYDGWFPETFRVLADAGAQIVCIPTNWVPMPGQEPKDEAMSNTLHRAAAHSNGLFIACADRVGLEREQAFVGQSIIVDSQGFTIAGPASWQEEDILFAEIDPSKIEEMRQFNEHNNILGDRRKDAY